MSLLLFQALFIRYSYSTGSKHAKNTQLLSGEMMGASMQILIGTSFLLKNLVRKGTILILRDENIQERKISIDFQFHSEFDGDGLVIEMPEEKIQLIKTMRPNDTCVIYKYLS